MMAAAAQAKQREEDEQMQMDRALRHQQEIRLQQEALLRQEEERRILEMRQQKELQERLYEQQQYQRLLQYQQQQQQQHQQQRTPPPRMLPVSQSPRFLEHQRQQAAVLLQQERQQQLLLQERDRQQQLVADRRQRQIRELLEQQELERRMAQANLEDKQHWQQQEAQAFVNEQNMRSFNTPSPARHLQQQLQQGRIPPGAFDGLTQQQAIVLQQRLLAEMAQGDHGHGGLGPTQEHLRAEAMRKIVETERQEERRRRKAQKIAHMVGFPTTGSNTTIDVAIGSI